MGFEFATAGRIVFGCGTVKQLPELCATCGRSLLLVTGSSAERHQSTVALLEGRGLQVVCFGVHGEPKTEDVMAGAAKARELGCDLVVGIGGGSVIDAGKAIAAMATQPGQLMDYLEVVGKGQALDAKPLPFIAVPTTAGTGAEVTRNAVLASTAHGVKASLRHVSMLPVVALVDPELARDLPRGVTAASGMDALTQCLEAYVSCKAQPMTDALCEEGIRRAARSLERVCDDGGNLAAREDLALAALFSGMALANAGLGVVHGFAAPIGGMFPAPHGAVCAALLAPAWEINLRAVKARGDDGIRRRFQTAAALLTGNAEASAEDAVPWLNGLTERLGIPGLRSYGLTEKDAEVVTEKAAKASSMKGNPLPLGFEELAEILLRAM